MKLIFRDGFLDFEWAPKCSDEQFEIFKKGIHKIFGEYKIMAVEEPSHERTYTKVKIRKWTVDDLALFWEFDDIGELANHTDRSTFSISSKLTSFKPLMDKRLCEKGIMRKPTKKELMEMMEEIKDD